MMPTIALTGDLAGGAISNSAGISSTINGSQIAVENDAVAAHAPCPVAPAHCAATTTASPASTINGRRIVLTGDPATCGHGAAGSAASRID